MKKISSLVLFLCLAFNICYGQWITQASGVTLGLNDVHFEDPNNGYAVGAGGTILKTNNSGINWSPQASGTTNQLNSVFFTSLSSGAVVGSAGFIAVTNNGGVNWFKQITGFSVDFHDIFYTDNMTAYIAGDGGKILKSTDGGLTWVSKPTGTTSDVFWSIWFTDSNTGYAVGGNFAFSVSKILKTTDAGENWTQQTSPTTDWFYNVSFGDGNNGWAAGPNGNIAKTTNGGSNWNLQNSGTATEWLYAVYALDSQIGFAGGGSGLILNTKDGGSNWTVQPTGITNEIRNFHFVNNATGWAVGGGGKILKYSPASLQLTAPNGAENWKAGTTEKITWTSNGIANVKIEYSTNNGSTWNLIVGSTAASAGEYLWLIPNNPSVQSLVKISDAVNSSMSDQSNAAFTISAPSLILNSPNGGERWRVGSTQNITWSSGSISKIKIVYSIDDRATWKLLADSVDATLGTYSWTVPDEPTLQAVVKISAVGDSLTRDDSNAPFHIEKASLTLNTPNGGQRWRANSVQSIFWNSLLVNKIKLEFSSDNGVNWSSIVDSVLASPGNYSWTTPNINSNICLIRISDKDDLKLADQSDSTFSIGQSSITLLSPNGGEIWKAGTNQDITWNSTFVSNVNIQFSSNGGANWSTIATNISAFPGLYNGSIPILNTNNALVKVTDAANSSIYDQSDSTFTVYQSTLSLNSPNGGESWLAGSTQNITWSSYKVMDLRIQYTTNNGANWINIAGPVLASSGSYSWVVPATVTNQAKVRIIDFSDSTLQDASNGAFNIFLKTISLQQPNGGEKWKVNSSQTISWIGNGITSTKIEYSTNSGISWNLINSNASTNLTGSSNNYTWVVPNTPTKTALIRVSDSADSTLKDVSNSVFEIFTSTLTLISPNGGERWKVGNENDITWSSSNLSSVKIQYSTNNGVNWNLITASAPADTGTYDWIIPDNRSLQVLVKISDAADSMLTDRSDAIFQIIKPGISLITPIGGERIRTGNYKTIEWEDFDVARVKIDFSSNNGMNWQPVTALINTPIESKYVHNWRTPDINSASCQIRIIDIDDPTVIAASESFELYRSTLEVISPNGGENIKAGSKHTIKWQATSVSKIRIAYSINGNSFTTIANNIDAALGVYEWNVPNINSSTCRVMVQDEDSPDLFKTSSADFTIYTPKIILISPNGGEKWKVGSYQNITWNSENIGAIKIEYSTNKGTAWKLIAASVPSNPPSYAWQVPEDTTSQAIIRVTDISDEKVFDPSDNAFKIIKPSITVTSPNGGENWRVGSTHSITWVSENVSKVQLEYSVNNGSTWKTIVSNISTPTSPSSYLWTIPDDVTSLALIRINAIDDANAIDISNSPFTIFKSSIKLLNPIANEVLQAEKNYNIKWQSEGVSKVKIEYWNGTWNEIANNVDAALESYSWLTTSLVGNIRLKISDVEYPSNFEEKSVRIASLKILSPNGGERLQWGVQTQIKWYDSDRNKSGKAIEVSSDNGTTWTLAGVTQDNVNYDLYPLEEIGVINWIPYGTASSQYKVRIKDHYLENLKDDGDGNFEVYKRSIAMTIPNGGETYQAKDKIYIVFNVDESITKVNLDYSTDNGANWNNIVTNFDVTELTAKGIRSYIWKAPNILSVNYKIRVTNSNNIQMFDDTDNTFTIKQRKLEIISPIENEVYSFGEVFNKTFWDESARVYRLKEKLYFPNYVLFKAKVDREIRYVNYLQPYYEDCNRGIVEWTPRNENDEAFGRIDLGYGTCIQGNFTVMTWGSNEPERGNPEVGDYDNVSVIVKPVPFAFTSPILSQVISVGKSFDIKWHLIDQTIQKVKIELRTSSGISVIVENHPAVSGKYTWQVPESLVGVESAVLIISDASAPNYRAHMPDLRFKIKQEFELQFPSNSRVIKAGSTQVIKWRSLNISSVKIEYTIEDQLYHFGDEWREIATVNSTTFPEYQGNYQWNTPNYVSAKKMILRFTDPNEATFIAYSDTFSVAPLEIIPTWPTNTNWNVGSTYQIKWKSVNVDTVNIDYSTNEGTSWLPIISNLKNYFAYSPYEDGGNNTYDWVIQNTPSNSVKVRIRYFHDPSTFAEMTNPITIQVPYLELTYPKDGDKLVSGSEIYILWQKRNIDGVKVEYSSDNGLTWKLIENNVYPNAAKWQVPNETITECKIRVSVLGCSTVYSQSTQPFSVLPKTPPSLTSAAWNNAFIYMEGESPKHIISDLSLESQIPNIQRAFVRMKNSDHDSIKNRYSFSFVPVPGISGSHNKTTQQLVFSGSASTENYKNILQSVTFSYTGDPHKLDGEVFNTLSLQVFDGQDSSNVITRPMTFTSINSSPVISDNSGSFLNYTIGEPPLKLVPSFSINDDVNLRGKATLEVNVVENYIMGEDLIGAERSPSITTSFLIENAKYKMTDNYAAPRGIQSNAKNGLYYLVENGAKSVGKTKKLEIQYFDDYQAASNKLIKNVTVKAPVSIAPNLRPPEEVKIAHIAGGNIRVSWKDPNGNVKGFIIYRTAAKVGKISASALSTLADEDIIGIVDGTKSDFIDNTTSEGFNYTYRIASFDTSGISDVSKQPPVVVNSIIKPPTNLSYKLTSYSTVQLNWVDNSEAEEGFILEAKHDTSTTFKEVIRLNKNLTLFNVYNFVYNRNYRFRLKAFNANSISDESNILEIKLQTTDAEKLGFIPNEFVLNQNYPNPFNPNTIISFSIPVSGFVTLRIFDILGNEITSLVREYLNPGLYTYDFDSKKYNLTSGIYVYQINYNNKTITKKFVLMK